MFLLGHLGIGERMGRPFVAPGARAALLLGCVLPDFVDKPLYYALSFATGRHGLALGLISGTRTFGHTLLFAVACSLLARIAAGRDVAQALFLGFLTHFLLDFGGEIWSTIGAKVTAAPPGPPGPDIFSAFFFPFLGPHFPVAPFHSLVEHILTIRSGYTMLGELIGGTLLLLDWRARRRVRAQERTLQTP